MIGIEILGRLGNQMFQYAFARIWSKKLHTDYFLLETNKLYIQKYFEIDFNHFQNTKYSYWFRLTHFFNKQILTENQQEPASKEMARFNSDTTIYKGFYQSASYFNGHKEELKNYFKIRDIFRVNFKKDIAQTDKPILAVHIRLTDYKTFGDRDLTLPIQYYRHCLEQIPNLNDYEIWVVSDAIPEAKIFFKEYPQFQFAEGTNLITDFQIMQQADALIIANSSFSWWAAYLNESKLIFAPQYWLGFLDGVEHPSGISDNLDWHWVKA